MTFTSEEIGVGCICSSLLLQYNSAMQPQRICVNLVGNKNCILKDGENIFT